MRKRPGCFKVLPWPRQRQGKPELERSLRIDFSCALPKTTFSLVIYIYGVVMTKRCVRWGTVVTEELGAR